MRGVRHSRCPRLRDETEYWSVVRGDETQVSRQCPGFPFGACLLAFARHVAGQPPVPSRCQPCVCHARFVPLRAVLVLDRVLADQVGARLGRDYKTMGQQMSSRTEHPQLKWGGRMICVSLPNKQRQAGISSLQRRKMAITLGRVSSNNHASSHLSGLYDYQSWIRRGRSRVASRWHSVR